MSRNLQERYESGIRQSMHSLPTSLQWALTWLTGKPLSTDERGLTLPKWLDVTLTPLLAVLSITGLVLLSHHNTLFSWVGTALLWLVLVGQLRKIQVTHLHHAIHNRLFDRPVINQIYASIMPSLIFIQNSSEYRYEHLRHHNARLFTTREDADAAFLARLGFLPGRSKSDLWTHLWITMFSPVFHLLFAKARLSSVFTKGTLGSRVLAMTATSGYLVLLAWIGWQSFLIAILVPMFLLYHVSALLQFLTEHAWNIADGPVRDWNEYQRRCWARFCGEVFPRRRQGGVSDVLAHAVACMRWSLSIC